MKSDNEYRKRLEKLHDRIRKTEEELGRKNIDYSYHVKLKKQLEKLHSKISDVEREMWQHNKFVSHVNGKKEILTANPNYKESIMNEAIVHDLHPDVQQIRLRMKKTMEAYNNKKISQTEYDERMKKYHERENNIKKSLGQKNMNENILNNHDIKGSIMNKSKLSLVLEASLDNDYMEINKLVKEELKKRLKESFRKAKARIFNEEDDDDEDEEDDDEDNEGNDDEDEKDDEDDDEDEVEESKKKKKRIKESRNRKHYKKVLKRKKMKEEDEEPEKDDDHDEEYGWESD
jgi:hypothetical protein